MRLAQKEHAACARAALLVRLVVGGTVGAAGGGHKPSLGGTV